MPLTLQDTKTIALWRAARAALRTAENALQVTANPNVAAQVTLRKLIEDVFHKRGGSLVNADAMATMAAELEVSHSCDTLPGGLLSCALRLGGLHAGPLCAANKIRTWPEHRGVRALGIEAPDHWYVCTAGGASRVSG